MRCFGRLEGSLNPKKEPNSTQKSLRLYHPPETQLFSPKPLLERRLCLNFGLTLKQRIGIGVNGGPKNGTLQRILNSRPYWFLLSIRYELTIWYQQSLRVTDRGSRLVSDPRFCWGRQAQQRPQLCRCIYLNCDLTKSFPKGWISVLQRRRSDFKNPLRWK